jgi:Ni/Co efflux regulator RcnB
MRKFLISLLLAGAAATPAIAGPHDWSDRQSAHEDRQSAHEDRQSARQESAQSHQQSHGDRSGNANRPQFSAPGGYAPQGRSQQPAFTGGGERANVRPDRGNFDGRFAGANGAANYVAPGPRMVQVPSAQDRAQFRQQRIDQRDVRQQGLRDARELRQSSRPLPNVLRDRHPLVVSNTPRPGTQPPLVTDGHHSGHWDTNWRQSGRYDWQNYRHHHRSLFHLGFFYDPYGWDYQPFSIGWRLWPGYYGQRYWINDPWMYRLPYAPPGYVWVRYWNDALLVDTFTGTVVDMIPGFFW